MHIYHSGTLIANRYEVVQGPREKPSLAGGMGLVYLCVDHAENGRPVALKTFRPELLPDRAARDRFLREGTTWVELGKHPHIVRCHEIIWPGIGPDVYIVLELVAAAEGKRDASLRSWLTSGKPIPVEQALLFALHIVRGMKQATTKIPNLVHRDLKPENVLVGQDGLARVTDFGLASAVQGAGGKLQLASGKESDDASLGRTQLTRGIAGTPLYMAPEQWAGSGVDVRTDIYAFGCILYEMIAGKFAVSGKNLSELEKAHRTGQINDIPLNLPNSLIQLLQQCIAVNRDKRYENWMKVEMEVTSAYKIVTRKDATNLTDTMSDTRADRVAAGWSYIAIGQSYEDIGKFNVAREYFEQMLTIARAEEEQSLEAAGLNHLGNIYRLLGDPRQAIEFHEKSLNIGRKIGDRQRESHALGNLGNAYLKLGDPHQAIEYFDKCLAIAREIGDRKAEGSSLGNLGIAHRHLGESQRAIEFHTRQLAIAMEIGDRHGESNALGSLVTAYSELGDLQRAIGCNEKRLVVAREIGDRRGEGHALRELGIFHINLGDPRHGIEYLEKSLVIVREIGDRRGEGQTFLNLGIAYLKSEDLRQASELCEKSLIIAREIGDRRGEGQVLANLGTIYLESGDLRQASEFYEKSSIIMREIGNVTGAALTSFNLARLFLQQGRGTEALGHAEYARQVFTQVGHMQYAQQAQQLIDQIQTKMT